jgi:ribosomal protein S13
MPTETLYTVIGFLIALVVGLIVYIWTSHIKAGDRLKQLVDKIFEKLEELTQSHHMIEIDLRGRLADLDRRVAEIRANCPSCKE